MLDEGTFDYDFLLNTLKSHWGDKWEKWVEECARYGVDATDPQEVIDGINTIWNTNASKNADGTYRIWRYIPDTEMHTYTPNPLNSNTTTTVATKPQIPLSTTRTVDKKFLPSIKPKVGQFTQNAMYYLGEASQAVTAASVGIALGKTIDSALYNANPDFWDSVGMSSLDPSTWGQITSGDDSLGSSLFNFIFGIDPDTNKTQAYMDADAFAYMSAWMKSAGVFDSSNEYIMEDTTLNTATFAQPFYIANMGAVNKEVYIDEYDTEPYLYYICPTPIYTRIQYGSIFTYYYGYYLPINEPIYQAYFTDIDGSNNYERIVYAIKPNNVFSNYNLNFGMNIVYYREDRQEWGRAGTNNFTSSSSYFTNWTTYPTFVCDKVVGSPAGYSYITPTKSANQNSSDIKGVGYVAQYMLYGESVSTGGIEGIGDQTGATLPDTSTWDTVPNTLTSLQLQYPDLFNNALQYDVLQPDGSVLTKTYVPVAIPDTNASTSNNPWNDQKPTTSTQTQTNTEVDPSTSTKTLLDFITKILQQTQTLPETDTDNPTPTGTGTTDPPIPPVGVGSALWSVYNPTQAQIDSFGGWLWSGDIITQIQQILQNPMEGIITLHKVFAPPVISGTGDIVVGRLSSGVSSNLVTNQYSYVDCGTVNLLEQFSNVFDYDPYTNVSLYLPFIGIVPLNTSDVMRGSINVKYGVDVFTGACLAMVTVTRDGNTVNLYQYSGVASVSYPLTGAQNSGLIGGLLSIAGGVASIATGNVVGGVLGAAGGVGAAAKSHMQRASSFSGNSGAMGIKIPYLIIERPQTKVASTFPNLQGYPTNTSIRLGDCSGQVRVRAVHVEGLGYATENEQKEIENLLYSGVLI